MSLGTRVQRLKEKKDAIMARLATAEAQQAREERKLAVHRKILIGAAILTAIRRGQFDQDQLMKLLSENLTDKDKKAFRV